MINKEIRIICMIFILFALNSYFVFGSAIQLDKEIYGVKETVNILVESNYLNDNYLLEIVSNKFVYRYLYMDSSSIKFIPDSIGDYSVVLINKIKDEVEAQALFRVSEYLQGGSSKDDIPKKDTNDEIVYPKQNKLISVRNSRNAVSVKPLNSLPDNSQNIRKNIKYNTNYFSSKEDLEVNIDFNSIKKIRFHQLDTSKNLDIGLDEVEDIEKYKIPQEDIKRVYAIDPSRLDFSTASVTSVAAGNELYKCKDWDFESQTCFGSWEKLMDVIPGQEYTFEITKNDPGFAETGIPTPHNVKGRVFNSNENGVDNGVPVKITNLNNSNNVLTYVYAPPIPSLKGSYSTNINGSDNDSIIVRAWNSTYYGKTSSILSATTTNVNVTLNISRPSETNATIITPLNHSFRELYHFFNITAKVSVIGNENGDDCFANIYISNEDSFFLYQSDYVHSLENISKGNYRLTNWSVYIRNITPTDIFVSSYCGSDGINFDGLNYTAVYNISVNDTSAPNITLLFPENNSWNNNENITFYFTADDLSNIKNCSLYFDSRLNVTNTSINKGLTNQIFANNLPQGNHSWLISCYDNSTNHNAGNSSANILKIDLSDPNISLEYPTENSSLENNTLVCRYNVSDVYGEIGNCSLIINNGTIETKYDVLQNTTQNFTSLHLSAGAYNWSVSCYDLVGNIGYSKNSSFNITDPDVAIYDYDIIFSKNNPVENEQIIITAVINNLGNENVTNVVVKFFENEPYSNSISEDIFVNISAGLNITVNATWNARVGSYNIYAVVDPPYETNGSIEEINESNNVANKTISIPLYHTYYGDFGKNIFLVGSSNFSFLGWFNESQFSGNIYVIDTDSDINWINLKALGRNLADATSINDFDEIDNILNTSQFDDSVKNIYTDSGEIRDNASFFVYGNSITNVPIVESTNSSNFVTGILWDSGDINPGQYNGSQDIVFVTEINSNKQGAYGVYDFEIKIPANLEAYVFPDIENSVTFYYELN